MRDDAEAKSVFFRPGYSPPETGAGPGVGGMIELVIVGSDNEKTRAAWRAETQAAVLLSGVAGVLDRNFGPLGEVAVLLTDDLHMRELNRRFRGRDRATNVLSFPDEGGDPDQNGETGGEEESRLGDIAIGIETLKAQAGDEGKPFDDHFRHLVLHGILHLMGYDHETEAQAEEMESLETSLLAELRIPDPYAAHRSDRE